jgi:hypothetical protein
MGDGQVMKKLLLRVQVQQDGPDFIWLEHADSIATSPGAMSPFNSNPVAEAIKQMGQGVLIPEIVGDAGHWLYEKIAENTDVQKALNVALNLDDDFPIYIELRSDEAEALPWEALRKPDGNFLTLDKRWPIGRVVTTGDERQEYHLDSQIKVTAVLAATGVDARAEWDGLWAAISASDLPVILQVLLCQDDLATHINSLNIPNSTVSFFSDESELLTAIRQFEPNIIHFFCHGSTEHKTPRLLLATKSDWLIGESNVQLYPSVLAEGSTTLNAWLVTLNCCRGAAPVEQAQSLARSLVVAGFPAVIGMREAVASTDANIFCRELYNVVFAELKKCSETDGKWVEVSWPKMLYGARRRLALQHAQGRPLPRAAAELKEWTLPTLYVRRMPFRIRGRSKNEHLSEAERQKKQTKLTALRQARDVLQTSPGTPLAVLSEIDQQITQLEEELYPSAPPNG